MQSVTFARVVTVLCVFGSWCVAAQQQCVCTNTTSVADPTPPPQADSMLKICAFNIQIFGVTKAGKPAVMEVIVKTLRRHDINVIQEIRDSSGTAIKVLMSQLNQGLEATEQYSYVISPRLGSSTSKEQYAYIYKSSRVEIENVYVPADEHFERPPYVVRFKPTGSSQMIDDFFMVVLHAKPGSRDTYKELSELTNVYDVAVARFKTTNAIIVGDFNADCSYLSKTKKQLVTLWQQKRFTWLIPDISDTTTKDSDCAYDRIVIAGDKMTAAAKDWNIFHYDKEYGLDKELTYDVSDHFPVVVYVA